MDTFAFGAVKIAVILFYKRIFSVGHFKFWANLLMGVIAVWTLAGWLGIICAAQPISNFWLGQFSINWGIFNMVMAVLDLLLDIVTLLLPFIAIRELQVTRNQKLSIIGLFWLGGVSVRL